MPTINRINANLATMADGKSIRFLNVNAKLADPSGTLFEGMMVDGLHPSLKGYEVWAEGLKPILTELLGPPAADRPRAPAHRRSERSPTGGPESAAASLTLSTGARAHPVQAFVASRGWDRWSARPLRLCPTSPRARRCWLGQRVSTTAGQADPD